MAELIRAYSPCAASQTLGDIASLPNGSKLITDSGGKYAGSDVDRTFTVSGVTEDSRGDTTRPTAYTALIKSIGGLSGDVMYYPTIGGCPCGLTGYLPHDTHELSIA